MVPFFLMKNSWKDFGCSPYKKGEAFELRLFMKRMSSKLETSMF